jgi:hypothetical protein
VALVVAVLVQQILLQLQALQIQAVVVAVEAMLEQAAQAVLALSSLDIQYKRIPEQFFALLLQLRSQCLTVLAALTIWLLVVVVVVP